MHISRRAVLAGLAGTGIVRAQAPVVIFAAASLKTALDAVIAELGLVAVASYGGSGAMARQITRRAPAHLFLSAHPQWMDVVGEAGRISPGTRVDLLGNALVLIGAPDAMDVQLPDIPEGRIATGLVEAVPAGQYAKAAFEALGLWGMVEQRMVQTENVRAALALVARGEVPLGVVYASDAMAEPAVRVLARFAPETHPPIVYPLALISPAPAEARLIWIALKSPAARAIFAQHGFERV